MHTFQILNLAEKSMVWTRAGGSIAIPHHRRGQGGGDQRPHRACTRPWNLTDHPGTCDHN